MAEPPLQASQCTDSQQTFHLRATRILRRRTSRNRILPQSDEKDNELVQYDILHNNNIVVLYGVDKTSFTFLREQYADIKFHAQSSPLIEYYAAKSRLGNNRKMYVYLQTGSLNVYAYERGRLLLANSFDCKVNADRIYYLLYIWKELGLDQERDELHLSGNLNEKKDLLAELRKFISRVFVMNPANNLDLQTINLCE